MTWSRRPARCDLASGRDRRTGVGGLFRLQVGHCAVGQGMTALRQRSSAASGARITVPRRAGEAVALRRRWLCHPLVPLADAGKFAGDRLRPDRRLRAAQGARARYRRSTSLPIDETNTRVRIDRIIATCEANGNFGFVGLVGVQSNQYPRSLHCAKPLRDAGINVVIGGFHVSGTARHVRRCIGRPAAGARHGHHVVCRRS